MACVLVCKRGDERCVRCAGECVVCYNLPALLVEALVRILLCEI